jgi:hypothetical protein
MELHVGEAILTISYTFVSAGACNNGNEFSVSIKFPVFLSFPNTTLLCYVISRHFYNFQRTNKNIIVFQENVLIFEKGITSAALPICDARCSLALAARRLWRLFGVLMLHSSFLFL